MVCFPWFKIYLGITCVMCYLVFVQRSVEVLTNRDCLLSAYYEAGFKAFLELLVSNALFNSSLLI